MCDRRTIEYVWAEEEKMKKEVAEYHRKKAEEKGQVIPPKDTRSWEEKMYVESDHPSTIPDDVATIWYIIIMVVGTIFNDRLLIWITATVVWWRHINRKAIRQNKWDQMHKGDKK